MYFAARNADCRFTTIPPEHDDLRTKLDFFRQAAPPGQLRNIFASSHLMIRRTRKEAEDYHHYIVYEKGDWESADYAFKLRGSRINTWLKADEDKLKARLISGAGFPCVGSYDDAVETFKRLSSAGLDGLAATPSSSIAPPSAGMSPESTRNAVVLPAPFGPSRPRISPG